VTPDRIGVLLAEGPELVARARVQITGRDVIRKGGIRDAWLEVAITVTVTRRSVAAVVCGTPRIAVAALIGRTRARAVALLVRTTRRITVTFDVGGTRATAVPVLVRLTRRITIALDVGRT
jgi:hypothetical protein